MRRYLFRRIFWLISIGLLLFPAGAGAFSLKTSTIIGKVVPLEGLVVIRRKTVGITVKPPAETVYRGDEVLTNEVGKARILLTGGNEVFIGPSSTLLLNKHFEDRYRYTYDLDLKGKLRAKVQRVRGRRFQVKTSSAVINVKGTDFIVDSTQVQTTQVATFDGLVSLTSLKTNQVVEIPPGQMSGVTTAGAVEEPKKVEVAIVKSLENTGKTGITTLDKIMEEPPPLDPTILMEIESEPLPIPEPMPEAKPKQEKPKAPVVVVRKTETEPKPQLKPEPQPKPEIPSFWYYAEQYRDRNRFGFGFGLEVGSYEGSYLFAEYNLTPRSQLHLQFAHNTEVSGLSQDSLSEHPLQRKINLLSFRYFAVDSGLYAGLGYGTIQFEQDYDLGGNNVTSLSAKGSMGVIELGVQGYGSAFNTTFYVAVGTQYMVNI